MKNTHRFNGLADVYAVGRPTYAGALIDDLYMNYGFSEESVIADVASGTGKFAGLLLDKGSFVYCVEPNDDMRSKAAEELSVFKDCRIVGGTDAQTSLEDNSVDFVTTAQAFHFPFIILQKKRLSAAACQVPILLRRETPDMSNI